MFPQVLDKSVKINADISKAWEVLTNPALVKLWLSESNMQIISEWKEGDSFVIKGDLHGINFENSGFIVQLEPQKIFEYNYLSNISNLPEKAENRTHVRFVLSEIEKQTLLQLSLRNFPTESIYRHVDFYWNSTLLEIKKVAENL